MIPNINEMYIMWAALEQGIIPPSLDIDKALSELSKEDARKAKRKYRKLVRKARAKYDSERIEMFKLSPKAKRRIAMNECFRIGLKCAESING